MEVSVIGLRGASFAGAAEWFRSRGLEAVLLEPSMVCGRDHCVSAAMHAERAFSEGRNRSRTMATETVMYAAAERQIGKALEKMRPKGSDMVAVVLGSRDPDISGLARRRTTPCSRLRRRKRGTWGRSSSPGFRPRTASWRRWPRWTS
ncbi:hypothetical protein AUQ37_04580 [Candidatus Methanomethylophilus sp. 1R26]|uniref:KEOPS complex subunit Cgi121 n=1 Tax=Candidatus Methanomethylophilus sp. 1R26 TaxID=1769296 RepID=UPI0007378970|nr:KEOPS complex subunit Cgi121 [Candidatus Methanomethylophilus sp. 1R26]KUE74381.1 hypothetical protein AUQ37_04580 [Candidatus Methanomethylophilus sp. 1R26]